ncbi:MAG: extracellular solute-binding protein [Candidatus Adlerbacteria bacterium]|nr:extracellular solute-binding protein [Candidatus Adlerbacteria bacterium]
MTNFQLVFTGIFIAFIVLGVIAFSFFTTRGSSVGEVHIWGTVDQNTMQKIVQELMLGDKDFQNVVYTQKSPDTYSTEVINAMARGSGPDIILLSQDQIQAFADKVSTIPYSVVSQSSIVSSYVGEAQLFLNSQGSFALPFLINPLVMYWNRDLFGTAGLAQAPQYWDSFLTTAQKLTVLDASSNIKKSAIALGGWGNITYAKAIISTLVMQAGDPIISYNADGTQVAALGTTPQNATENPAASALQFYTEFANPSKVTYSWNRSLPNSFDAFVAGDVAVYIGFASDYWAIAARNPNLRFGVATVPQIQGSSAHVTFGQMTGLAIPRTATNVQGALVIAQKLSSQVGVATAAQVTGLPPVRLDVVQDTNANAAVSVFNQSALIARAWLDPNTTATDAIFKTMIESIVSNKALPSAAVEDAMHSLQALIGQNSQ